MQVRVLLGGLTLDLFIVAIVSFVAGIGVGMAIMVRGRQEQDGYCSECRRMFRYGDKWNHTCPHCGARIGIPPPQPWPRAAPPPRPWPCAKPIGQVCRGVEGH